jgi:hypothetical protein
VLNPICNSLNCFPDSSLKGFLYLNISVFILLSCRPGFNPLGGLNTETTL